MRKSYLFCLGLVTLLLAVGNVGQAQDSLGMHRVGTLEYWDYANDIQMVGNLVYVMGGLSGLHIISLADPANPVEIGRYTWYPLDVIGGVYVTGNLAYVCLYYTCVVLDVSNPANPITLGEWDVPGNITEITFVHENIAIAAGDDTGPYILDVSDPTNGHYIGGFPDPVGGALGMAGEYLCMAGYPGGVTLYDISDPTQPQWVATCDTTLQAGGSVMSGNYAYVATYSDGLHIIDLTSPLQPSLIAVCDSAAGIVTVTGSHAIITCSGLHIWNVADPVHPMFESALEIPNARYGVERLSSSGNLVCAGKYRVNPLVSVADISNPTEPMIVNEFGNYGDLEDIAISESMGYISDAGAGLRTIDLTDPNHVSELGNMFGHFPLCGDLCIVGNYAYVVADYWGLYVIDVSNPMQLDSVSCRYTTARSSFKKVFAEENYLYVFDAANYTGHSYLRTFNLIDPEAPACVDSLPILLLNGNGYFPFGAAALDGYLYLAKGSTFQVFSLANPVAPQLVGSCNLSSTMFWEYDLAAAGHYVYVANAQRVRIVDVQDPTHPSEVNWINGNWMGSVAAIGNIMIMDDRTRISMYDVTYPNVPSLVGYYSTTEDITDMEIQGQYLFTISLSGQFNVFQVDTLTGVISPTGIAPHEFALYPCYPNPFNPSTMIRFSLPFTEYTKLTIYDVTGRQVEVLANEVLSAGEHRITFDGSGLSSGVYFVRLQSGHHTQTEKMVLLK
jgi:hypothetical protein